jgi:hypothetical protein
MTAAVSRPKSPKAAALVEIEAIAVLPGALPTLIVEEE